MANEYKPEPYWSEVAKRIEARQETQGGEIAGDDEPYYRYKRARLLDLLNSVDFKGRSVLEVGSGPGGNLNVIWQHQPSRLAGVDISADMIKLATSNRASDDIELFKTNGTSLPFEDGEFDTVITVTVLQHNTDEEMFKAILDEVCRVAAKRVILFERVESTFKGDDLCVGRPVKYYEKLAGMAGYRLADVQYLNIQASYLMAGVTRKVLNPSSRVEGQPLTPFSLKTQDVLMPLTKVLDKIVPGKRDLAQMTFERQDPLG